MGGGDWRRDANSSYSSKDSKNSEEPAHSDSDPCPGTPVTQYSATDSETLPAADSEAAVQKADLEAANEVPAPETAGADEAVPVAEQDEAEPASEPEEDGGARGEDAHDGEDFVFRK